MSPIVSQLVRNWEGGIPPPARIVIPLGLGMVEAVGRPFFGTSYEDRVQRAKAIPDWNRAIS